MQARYRLHIDQSFHPPLFRFHSFTHPFFCECSGIGRKCNLFNFSFWQICSQITHRFCLSDQLGTACVARARHNTICGYLFESKEILQLACSPCQISFLESLLGYQLIGGCELVLYSCINRMQLPPCESRFRVWLYFRDNFHVFCKITQKSFKGIVCCVFGENLVFT